MTSFSRDEYAEERFDGVEVTDSEVRFKSFDQCTFRKCRFNSARFIECRFNGCQFTQCDLSLAVVKHCIFSGVTFENCKLVGINWTEADLSATSLLKALAFDGCTLNYGTFIGLALQAARTGASTGGSLTVTRQVSVSELAGPDAVKLTV